MDPKRLRFSDLSSDSGSSTKSSGRFSRSSASSPSTDLVLRLSTSFTSISTASGSWEKNNGDSHSDFRIPLPVTEPPTNPSRQSFATTTSGTTVWTAHGSARTTMGIGNHDLPSGGTVGSTENTETIDHEAIKLRRRTVATVSSNNSCHSEARSVTPTENSTNSPTINIQKKAISIADDTEELPPTQPSGPLKGIDFYLIFGPTFLV